MLRLILHRALVLHTLLVGTLGVATLGAQAPGAAGSVSLSRFGALRWMEGRWMGSGGGYRAFYESYRFVDDSTLVQETHTDSTYGRVESSFRIVLRDGAVLFQEGQQPKAATLFRGDSVAFGPSILFVRRDDSHWTAILAGGRVIYEMRRRSP